MSAHMPTQISRSTPPYPTRNTVFIYIFAQLLGGALCALFMLPLYGPGPVFTSDDAHESQALAVQMTVGAKARERAGLISVGADGRGAAPDPWEVDPRY